MQMMAESDSAEQAVLDWSVDPAAGDGPSSDCYLERLALGSLCNLYEGTLRPSSLKTQGKPRHPRETGSMQGALIKSLHRPFLLISLEPMCLDLCVYTAVMIGTLCLFFSAFPLIFAHTYGSNLWQIGLTFLGQLVGTIIGASFNPLFYSASSATIRPKPGTNSGEFLPEFRLPPAILGALLLKIGLFWFGWSSCPDVHWIMPVIGSAFFV
jgi:hypothetical protein